jgi:hypothetical protein
VVPVGVGGSGGVPPPVGAWDVEEAAASRRLEAAAMSGRWRRRRRPAVATLMSARGELGAMDYDFYFSFDLILTPSKNNA